MELFLGGYAIGVITVLIGGFGYSAIIDVKESIRHRRRKNRIEENNMRNEGIRVANGGGRR